MPFFSILNYIHAMKICVSAACKSTQLVERGYVNFVAITVE